MPGGQRVLVVGPLEGPRWRSITGLSETLADELARAGLEVAKAGAPWWNPPSLLDGARARWWRQPGIQAARNGVIGQLDRTESGNTERYGRDQDSGAKPIRADAPEGEKG